MREVIFKIVGSAGVNGTNTVAVKEGTPYSIVKELILRDANSNPLITLDGYALQLARKYGGYRRFKSANGPAFAAVSVGSSGTGNFEVLIHCFLEFGRDGLGCLPNDEGNTLYKYDLTLAASTDIFSTAPGTLPTITVSVFVPSRGTPDQVDVFGNPQSTQPPNPGTTQYWDSETFDVVSGNNVIQVKQVGNLIRNHGLVFTSSTDGTRATAATDGTLPAQMRMDWDKGTVFDNTDVDILHQAIYDATGYNISSDDPGVIWLSYTDDNTQAGQEYGDYWMPTVASSKIVFRFKSTHAGSVQIITNYVVPGSGNIYAAPAMEING